jgi:hypothetical protein
VSHDSQRLTVIDYEALKDVTATEREHAERLVERMARDEADRQLLLDVLFGEPQVKAPRGLKGPERRDPDTYQPCGTEARYQRHRRHGEYIDEACRKAASQSRMESQRRTRARRKAETAAKEAA